MLGPSGHEEIVALNRARMEAYRLQAEIERQLPKHSLRRQIAKWLRSLAESLEPSQPFPAKQLRQA